MENKKAYNKALIHIVCCIIIILVFVITSMQVNALSYNTEFKPMLKDTILKINIKNNLEIGIKQYDAPRIINNNIYVTLEKYNKTIIFFSKVFGFDENFIKEDLIERNINNTNINKNNIGCIKNNKNFKNFEQGIIEYFFEISNLYPEKKSYKYIPYTGDSKYIENLIIYFTNIYDNVDTTLALSIGAAESGYYKVKYMLEKNNVFGGMGSNGLIVYENIEMGILKYIKLLSEGYFEKGLTTKETIGKKYCPQINEDGIKVASSHWINLVGKAENKYKNYSKEITIDNIIVY